MTIHLDSLSEEELINLNEQIIKRLKELKAQSKMQQLSEFRMGEVISFLQGGKKEEGIIIRINQKTISVITATHTKWILSPNFVMKEKRPSEKIRTLQLKLFPKP